MRACYTRRGRGRDHHASNLTGRHRTRFPVNAEPDCPLEQSGKRCSTVPASTRRTVCPVYASDRTGLPRRARREPLLAAAEASSAARSWRLSADARQPAHRRATQSTGIVRQRAYQCPPSTSSGERDRRRRRRQLVTRAVATGTTRPASPSTVVAPERRNPTWIAVAADDRRGRPDRVVSVAREAVPARRLQRERHCLGIAGRKRPGEAGVTVTCARLQVVLAVVDPARRRSRRSTRPTRRHRPRR